MYFRMYLESFHSRVVAIVATLFLLASLLVVGSVHAEGEGGETSPPQDPPQEEVAAEGTSEQGSDGEAGEDGTSPPQDPLVTDGDSTPDGEAGESGDEVPPVTEDEGEAIIETGDAEAISNSGTVVNENDTNVNHEEGDAEPPEVPEDDGVVVVSEEDNEQSVDEGTTDATSETDTTSQGTPSGDEDEGQTVETSETEVSVEAPTVSVDNDNEADVANAGTTEAESGANAAAASSLAGVNSGDAFAAANVVNVVNTNIYNSNGFLLLINAITQGGIIDLRDLDFFGDEPGTASEESCSLEGCSHDNVELNITNDNDATITNDIIVRASTGNNTAVAGNGSAFAQTGDAFAAANVINVANTNFVDSNYLLLVFNNMTDFVGDIVLPGPDFFTDFITSGGRVATPRDVDVTNNNDATIENNVDVEANTGENTVAAAGGTAVAVTGDATASTNIVNNVNQNNFNADKLFVLFRVYGDWVGDAFNVPDNIAWSETPFGIQFMNKDSGLPGETVLPGDLSVTNNNTASITNNVDVFALTGANRAIAGAGNALVDTGDAHAAANVVNIANTNVVGRNWVFAIFNIFGDFTGNVSFGQPDLWIGARAESNKNPITPGASVDFHFTVTNFGDSDAHNVIIENFFDTKLMKFASTNQRNDSAAWSIGTVPAGETVEVSYSSVVDPNLGYGQFPIVSNISVSADETDGNPDDNNDTLTILAQLVDESGYDGGWRYEISAASDLKVEKVLNGPEVFSGPGAIDYIVNVKNDGGPSYYSLLLDTLVNLDTGDVVSQKTWDLGRIEEGEDITLTYTVEYSETGRYANYAEVKAVDTSPVLDPFIGSMVHSNVASTTIWVLPTGQTEAPVAVVPEQCTQYIHEFLKQGHANDIQQVQRLQRFLAHDEGFRDVDISGSFDSVTFNAVQGFQERYRADILDPWGIANPTGYVYLTTRKKINEIYCNNTIDFLFSDSEQEEIDSYKQRVLDALNNQIPLPDTSDVGYENVVPIVKEDEAEQEFVVKEVQQDSKAQSASVGNVERAVRRIFSNVLNGLQAVVQPSGESAQK